MPSLRLNSLRERVEELRAHLLPAVFDPTGNYAERDRIGTTALSFRVLAHAEIETYFEDRVVEIAKAALNAWKSKQHVSRTALYLVAFSGNEMARPPDTLTAPNDNKRKTWPDLLDIQARLEKASSEFIGRVLKENHGIREKNILAMLIPIGVDSNIDNVLVTNLDNLGQRRGEAAHSSTSSQVRQGVDPKDEYERVTLILAGLGPVDSELDKLLLQATAT